VRSLIVLVCKLFLLLCGLFSLACNQNFSQIILREKKPVATVIAEQLLNLPVIHWNAGGPVVDVLHVHLPIIAQVVTVQSNFWFDMEQSQ
jgi:hypothetical protein